MSTGINIYVIGIFCFAVGVAVSLLFLFFRNSLGQQKLKNAALQAKGILDEAQKNAEPIVQAAPGF
jgi:hypothetical protein